MLIAFILLILIILLVCYKYISLNKGFTNTVQEQKNLIDALNEEIVSLNKQKELLHNKVDDYHKEILFLHDNIEALTRKVNFYKDIEEESEKLNSSDSIDSSAYNTFDAEFSQKDSVLDDEQLFALDLAENTNQNLFITGKAGTGKSFLLNYFKIHSSKKYIILAPTGISALNVNGATLHSTFGYHNLVNLDIDSISYDNISLKSEKKLLLKKVSTIIIDEISMVRADTFDKIDRILKVINQNNLPFGGKQLLIFGDLFQLPPIVKRSEHDFLYDKYGGPYFFNSPAYKNSNFKFIELSINHRQKDDAAYFELLNRIREGQTTKMDIDILNTRIVSDESIYDRFTSLLPTKAEVEIVNKKHINQLDSKQHTYPAIITFDKNPDNTHNIEATFPIMNVLNLKKGALVMMTSNDPEQRWVNGTLGIINKLFDNSIFVSINKRTYEIHPIEFTEQEITYSNGTIKYEDSFKVLQYPIIPAYAITIHKSQGQTFKNIVCDIDRCFTNGQAYVALSRCTSLTGLHLTKKITGSSIQVDKAVLDFYKSQIKLNP